MTGMLCCVAPRHKKDKKGKTKPKLPDDDSEGGFREKEASVSQMTNSRGNETVQKPSTGATSLTNIQLDSVTTTTGTDVTKKHYPNPPLSARISYDTDIRTTHYDYAHMRNPNVVDQYKLDYTRRPMFSFDEQRTSVTPAKSLPSLIDEPEITRFPKSEKFRFHGSTASLSNIYSGSTLSLDTAGEESHTAMYGSTTQLHTQMLDRRFQKLKERAELLRKKDTEIRKRYQDLLDKRKSICEESPEANISYITNPRANETDSTPVAPPRRRRSLSMSLNTTTIESPRS